MDLVVADLGLVEIPFMDCGSDFDPEPPVSPDQLRSRLGAQRLCRNLVNLDRDSVAREKLPRLNARGSPLQIIENRIDHTVAPPSFFGEHPIMSFFDREGVDRICETIPSFGRVQVNSQSFRH